MKTEISPDAETSPQPHQNLKKQVEQNWLVKLVKKHAEAWPFSLFRRLELNSQDNAIAANIAKHNLTSQSGARGRRATGAILTYLIQAQQMISTTDGNGTFSFPQAINNTTEANNSAT